MIPPESPMDTRGCNSELVHEKLHLQALGWAQKIYKVYEMSVQLLPLLSTYQLI